ncbi:hypothetical protein [Adhaeribacter arboris]|uniref:hypothetical protein n=1 Tax=Adhaeribacter arboris TaxID=2072846 RepID=UPI0011B267DC|nr:hypothetical protein [Adhaeribacter arboris]
MANPTFGIIKVLQKMAGLLDSIFSTGRVNSLSKKELHRHLSYLHEIIPLERSKKRVLQYRHWQARLFWQLVKVNRKKRYEGLYYF